MSKLCKRSKVYIDVTIEQQRDKEKDQEDEKTIKKKVKKYMKVVSRYVCKKITRESSPHMQKCKTMLENKPIMQANMQSGSPASST